MRLFICLAVVVILRYRHMIPDSFLVVAVFVVACVLALFQDLAEISGKVTDNKEMR